MVILASDRLDRRCESMITPVCMNLNLGASPSIKVVTELQLTIEAMLHSAVDPIAETERRFHRREIYSILD